MRPPSPSRLMWLLFIGFALSLAYGLSSTGIIYTFGEKAEAQKFLMMYVGSFNTLVTFGLIIATALIVGHSQYVIPGTIEAAFDEPALENTSYKEHKDKYFSLTRTTVFASEMLIVGFLIFHFCQFPLSGLAEAFMMIAGCAQWGFASYVGRKLRYAAMMLHSLLPVKVSRNLFKERELDIINTSVNIASTMTIIWVYLHVRSYYGAPFLYESFLGRSAQVFLLLPAVLATPVLLMFNFFPREVLRKIYNRSIDIEVDTVQEEARTDVLSPFEKRLRLMELEKMHREELRYSLQLTLSDLPIGITIVAMVVEPFISH